MSYRKVFNNPYPEGWVDLPNEDTSISAAALQAHTDAIEKMDSYLEKIGKAEDAGYIQMNMFNMSTVYIGKKLGDEGELVDDPGSMTTDFIEIDDKVQYMLSALNDSECLVKVHAYNSDFEWMMLCAMQTFYENVVFPFAVVNGAKYIKVSLSKDAKEVVLEDGYITHPYLPSNKELAAELSEQKESLIQFKDDGFLPKNLFNPSNVLNANISTEPSITSSDRTRLVYAKCEPNKTYTVSKMVGARFQVAYTKALPSVGVNFFGKVTQNSASSITITTGADAEYIVAFVYSSSSGDSMSAETMIASVQIEEGTEATQYVPYAISNQGLTQIVEDAKEYGYIGLNSDNEWLRGNIESDGSITPTSNTRIYTNNFIKVNPNDTLYLKLPSDMSYGLACYNASKGWIGFSGGWRTDDNPTIPSNTYFVRISLKYTDNSTITTNKAIRVDTVPSNSELKQSLAQIGSKESIAINNTYGLVASRINGIVTLKMNSLGQSMPSTQTVLGTLPSGWRPFTNVQVPMYITGTVWEPMVIMADGVIRYDGTEGRTYVKLLATYIADN